MKTIIITILLVLFTSLSYSADTIYGSFHNVEYVRNYDGDTITVTINRLHPLIGEKINIRVNGVDTPEIRGKCFRERFLALSAKVYVGKLLSTSKHIDLLDVQRGKYFRIVANVVIDNKDLSIMLIDNGYAVPYNGGTKTKDWCE